MTLIRQSAGTPAARGGPLTVIGRSCRGYARAGGEPLVVRPHIVRLVDHDDVSAELLCGRPSGRLYCHALPSRPRMRNSNSASRLMTSADTVHTPPRPELPATSDPGQPCAQPDGEVARPRDAMRASAPNTAKSVASQTRGQHAAEATVHSLLVADGPRDQVKPQLTQRGQMNAGKDRSKRRSRTLHPVVDDQPADRELETKSCGSACPLSERAALDAPR